MSAGFAAFVVAAFVVAAFAGVRAATAFFAAGFFAAAVRVLFTEAVAASGACFAVGARFADAF